MCDQQGLRSACTYAQSDQSLCWTLEYSMTVKLLTEHHLEFLSLKGDCTGLSESTLVKIPHFVGNHMSRLINLNRGDHQHTDTGACKHFLKQHTFNKVNWNNKRISQGPICLRSWILYSLLIMLHSHLCDEINESTFTLLHNPYLYLISEKHHCLWFYGLQR